MYKYETHAHTKQGSHCSMIDAAELAEFYKSKGYDGLFITDHFFNGNTAVPDNLPWEERVELFCKGYEKAKKRGDEIGLDVFFGWESSFWGPDILVYGLDKQWLLTHPDVMKKTDIRQFISYIHLMGGIAVQAHPFREAPYIDRFILLPDYCDGVEVINSHNSDTANEMAEFYAEKYTLPAVAGSDNHVGESERLSGIITEERIKDSLHYGEILKSGRFKIFDEHYKLS